MHPFSPGLRSCGSDATPRIRAHVRAASTRAGRCPRRASHFHRLLSRLALFVLAAVSAPNALPAWTNELYVWQRAPGPAVQRALERFAPQVDGFNVLAAEVNWRGAKAEIVKPPVDFAALARLGRPIGISLRIGAYRGAFAEQDAVATQLVELARERLAAARAAGLSPAELQIDFDCAESKLAGYRAWLIALKAAVGNETPLVFTSLPVWLKHEHEFRALTEAADGFVLQVHSLEKPSAPNETFTLCDPVRALEWARTAEKFAQPFRVALPTYGYVLAFGRDGKFLGLGAEMARPDWPRDAQLRTVIADAPAMSGLARALAAQNLAHCRGLLWFRLPVAGDRLNWDAATLAAVLRGETPRGEPGVEFVWSAGGLVDVVLVNRGTDSAARPAFVELRWTGEAVATRPLAGDGLAGCTLEISADPGAVVRVNNFSTENLLRPGQRVKVAWLRFSHELSLTARVAEKTF